MKAHFSLVNTLPWLLITLSALQSGNEALGMEASCANIAGPPLVKCLFPDPGALSFKIGPIPAFEQCLEHSVNGALDYACAETFIRNSPIEFWDYKFAIAVENHAKVPKDIKTKIIAQAARLGAVPGELDRSVALCEKLDPGVSITSYWSRSSCFKEVLERIYGKDWRVRPSLKLKFVDSCSTPSGNRCLWAPEFK
ncbi:MAG: hypothetical protein ACXWSZ_11900 [Bdellovibrionota bacterium]